MTAIACAVCLNIGAGLTVTDDPGLRSVINHMWVGAPMNNEAQKAFKYSPLSSMRKYYYASTTAIPPMTELRTSEALLASLQDMHSENIYKDVKNIAEKEAMKFATRQSVFNHEKYVEGPKISRRCNEMDRLITLAGRYGVSSDKTEGWEMRRDMCRRTAPKVIEDAYMPIGDRKSAYVGIYNEATEGVDELNKVVRYQYNVQQLKKFDRTSNYHVYRSRFANQAQKSMTDFMDRARSLAGNINPRDGQE